MRQFPLLLNEEQRKKLSDLAWQNRVSKAVFIRDLIEREYAKQEEKEVARTVSAARA